MKSIEQIIQLQLLLQSVIHKIEDLDGNVLFKQKLKQLTNNYYTFITRLVEGVTDNMDLEEGEVYVEMVNELDKLVNSFKLDKV